MLVDSHCHLNLLDFKNENQENSDYQNYNLDYVIADCKKNSLKHLLCIAIDLQNFPKILDIANTYSNISLSAGVHPNETEVIPGEFDISLDKLFDNLLRQANNNKVIAIGETGLDYYRGTEHQIEQQARFLTHIEVATLLNKPLIIHTRMAQKDTIELLKKHAFGKINGVMHCFTESWEIAQQALDLGFYISLSGIVTFKNAKDVHEVAKKTPIDRLLIETDCPYLAPMPFRGKPNYPHYVKYVAQTIADLRNQSFEEIAINTTSNFYKLFNIAT